MSVHTLYCVLLAGAGLCFNIGICLVYTCAPQGIHGPEKKVIASGLCRLLVSKTVYKQNKTVAWPDESNALG